MRGAVPAGRAVGNVRLHEPAGIESRTVACCDVLAARPRARLSFVIALVTCASVLAASTAEARGRSTGKRNTSDWHFTFEVGTDFPLQLGGHFTLETPGRVQIMTSLGALPSGYVDVMNAIIVGTGGYSAEIGDVVRAALRDSFLLRTRVGWRPFEEYGFYFGAGYTMATVGGDVSGKLLITLLSDDLYNQIVNEVGNGLYAIDTTLHMIDFEIGYRLLVGSGWSFRFALGSAFTVAGSTSVAARFTYLDPDIQALVESKTANFLDELYPKYVHPPVLTIAIGYQFM